MSFVHKVDELLEEHGNGLTGKAEHWQRVRLAEVAQVVNGFPFPSGGFNNEAGEPVLRIRDITVGKVGTYFKGAVDGAPRVEHGDLVVGMDGDFNSRLWPGEAALMNQRVCKIVPDEGVYSKSLLAYALPGYLKLVNDHTSAVTVKHLSSGTVADLPLPLPPRPEQDRLVSKIDELFSRIDEGERALERVQKLVERYRQSVLKAAVTGELTREWREKNKDKLESGEVLLARILKARREAWEKAELAKMKAKGITPANDKWKQKYKGPPLPDTSDLPELPDGWTWASLAQLSWASSYGTSQKCDAASSGIAVLRIPNIRGGAFSYEDIKNATADLELEAGDALAPGDLLVIRTNGSESLIGVGATLLAGTPFPCYFASYLIRFRLVLPSALSEWVNFCWQSHVVRQFIHEHKATSAGQYNVSQSSLMTLRLPVPPVDEINEVVEELKRSFSKSENALASVNTQVRHTTALRQGVLKSAFSGLLVSQSPTDEPATTLLERIAAERGTVGAAAPRRGRRRKPA